MRADEADAGERGTPEDGEEPRRRRRRGGRGRGRGRGRSEDEGAEGPRAAPERAPPPSRCARAARPGRRADEDEDDVDVAPPPRTPRATPFGSVWDSQLGTPAASTAPRAPDHRRRGLRRAGDPGVPDRRAAPRQRRPGRWRWRRARCPRRPVRLPVGHGARALRPWRRRGRHQPLPGRERPATVVDAAARRPGLQPGRSSGRLGAAAPRSSSEPWSDVPPELEAMLRAQVAQKPAPSPAVGRSSNPAAEVVGATRSPIDAEPIAKPRAARKPRATAATAAVETSAGDEAAPAKPRATRKPAASRRRPPRRPLPRPSPTR